MAFVISRVSGIELSKSLMIMSVGYSGVICSAEA